MFRGLENCRITTGKRYYRTEENRPNLEKLAFELRTSTDLNKTIDNARKLLNALKVDDVIKKHESLISQCMAYIKKDTEQGTIITKDFMANYLRTTCNLATRGHYGWCDPRGATEVALERLTEQGYLRRVKVCHKTDVYGSIILEAYQVI